MHVLFNQQHRLPRSLESPQCLEQAPRQGRRKAKRQLIEHQHRRTRHQPSRHGHHLLFPSAQRPSTLLLPLLKPWKQLERSCKVVRDLVRLASKRRGAQFQILAHRHRCKQLPPLRYKRDPPPCPRVRWLPCDVLAPKENAPLGRHHQSGRCPQKRRLASSVHPNKRREPPLCNGQADVMQHGHFSVPRCHASKFQDPPCQGRHRSHGGPLQSRRDSPPQAKPPRRAPARGPTPP